MARLRPEHAGDDALFERLTALTNLTVPEFKARFRVSGRCGSGDLKKGEAFMKSARWSRMAVIVLVLLLVTVALPASAAQQIEPPPPGEESREHRRVPCG